MFFKKAQKQAKLEYDPLEKQPVIRCSICTGEQVGGLKDLRTGKFEEIMVIRGDEGLKIFKELCGVEEIRKEY